MKGFGKGMVMMIRTLDWLDWFYLVGIGFFGFIGGIVASILAHEFK